jgi:hypothetical protein
MKVCKNEGCANISKKPDHNYCCPCIMAKHRYGITIPQRDSRLADQQGLCCICGKEIAFDRTAGSKDTTANIDHCHKTGSVRGILCWPCNVGIGKLKDDPKILRRAASYIEGVDSYES